jgi:tetratricopeptide (TPR) repeat protein/SAM-dependent methyltransferase
MARPALGAAIVRAESSYALGNALAQQGRLDESVAYYRRALSLRPDYVEAHNNLGIALQGQGLLKEAAASYRDALSLRPQSHYLHYNLGNVLRDDGELDEAATCYRRALSCQPDFAEAHNNLGVVLQRLGRVEEAVTCYRAALALTSNFAEAHYALGTARYCQGRPAEAAACFCEAIAIRPDLAAAHADLGDALTDLGNGDEAVASYRQALALKESTEFRMRFAQGIRHINFVGADAEIRQLVARALSEPWARPDDLAVATIALLRTDQDRAACIDRAAKAWPTRLTGRELFGAAGLDALFGDGLLQCLLENAPVCDIALERFLTMVRNTLLESAILADRDALEPRSLIFHCALARQCFVNDFVFSYTTEELHRATSLRDKLVTALRSGAPAPAQWVPAVATYFPLSTLPYAEALLRRSWPDAVKALLVQQVVEPVEERLFRREIPQLTAIDDTVSLLVQQQYEENPYPKWIKLPPTAEGLSIDEYVRQHFPLAPFHPLTRRGEVDILAAGCGTGREPIDLARQFAGARVLAVDMSLSSLCYASRKTRELGLHNVEYSQGDLMRLHTVVGRLFDLVSAVGVLHHLVDPVAGWAGLLSLLRPGGLMLVGLYSERARQSVVLGRKFITEQGYAPNADGIRQCRQDLMSLRSGALLKEVTSFNDFYVTSECRDLLFHVQEHHFRLPQLKEVLERLGLTFLGFFLERRLLNHYAACFPDDISKTNLDCWNEFETRFPRTFAGMYVFMVQKPV